MPPTQRKLYRKCSPSSNTDRPRPRPRSAGTDRLYDRTDLVRRLLALGAARWRLFFVTRAAVRPAEPVRPRMGRSCGSTISARRVTTRSLATCCGAASLHRPGTPGRLPP